MPKKQTFQQRLVAWAITASDDELTAAMDTLKAFRSARSPKPRKPRTTRTPTSSTPATNAAGASPSAS